jgi:hypothetical protein
MNHKLEPASRLTIVFILAVILSGSVLTYFSINNISNLKQLTEKKILEEQRELSSRFSTAIQNNIEKVTDGFNNEINLSPALKDSLLKRTSEYGFIIQPFILKNNGQFLYPNFIGIPENLTVVKLSSRFNSVFRKGVEAEFAEKNQQMGKDFYLLCLNHSIGNSDSVKALNALGRASSKLKDFKDAILYYSLIISDYSSVTDENGLPYSYYALPQLLKITNANNPEKILPTVEYFLEKMETGSIPLNFNTEELLMLVTDWFKDNTFNNRERSANIDKPLESIKKQVQFTIKYGNELSELVKKEI